MNENKSMTKEEIIDKMVETMPFKLNERIIPYIIEAMDIYAKEQLKLNKIQLWKKN